MKKWFPFALISQLLSCGEMPRPVASDVVGSYKGTYAGAEDFIELRADGQMRQRVLQKGKEYTGQGTWRISGRMIVIDGILRPVGLRGEPVEPPEKYAYMEGLWVVLDDRRRIVFNIDIEYGVSKVRPSAASPRPSQ